MTTMADFRYRAHMIYRGLISDGYANEEIDLICELIQKLTRDETI